MSRIHVLLWVTLVFTTPLGAQAAERLESSMGAGAVSVCHQEVCFPVQTQVAGDQIPLRNTAMLKVWGFDVYTAALYVPPKAVGVRGVLETSPKTLVLHYHRSIRAQQIIKAANKVLEKNPEIDLVELQGRLDTMYGAFVDVEEGDRYELRHEPGRGSVLAFNGEESCVIVGDDFAEAFFGIWLSEEPLNDRLRDELISH